jgi:hypothetical protein
MDISLQKLKTAQLFEKFVAFYETWKFIVIFATAIISSVDWAAESNPQIYNLFF